MVLDALAPWAEPALLTANDLMARADDSWRYELVEGRLVRMPPSGYEHSHVAGTLFMVLRSFVDAHELGTVTLPETGFLVSRGDEPDTVLAPDLAFIAAARASVRGSQNWKGFPPASSRSCRGDRITESGTPPARGESSSVAESRSQIGMGGVAGEPPSGRVAVARRHTKHHP
jgi:hypothetical protein